MLFSTPRWDDPAALRVTVANHTFLDSTQRVARQGEAPVLHTLKPNQWHWILADQQQAGIGQGTHTFTSPLGGFYGTLCFLWPAPQSRFLSFLSMMGALSVRMALQNVLPDQSPTLQIKWINDLMIEEKKLGGVMGETLGTSTQTPWIPCLLGIGLNVNVCPSLPCKRPLTSLQQITGRTWCLESLRTHLELALHLRLSKLLRGEISPLLEELNLHLWRRGKTVYVQTQEKRFRGTLLGIHEEGGMLIELSPTHIQRFLTGKLLVNSPENMP